MLPVNIPSPEENVTSQGFPVCWNVCIPSLFLDSVNSSFYLYLNDKKGKWT